MSLHSQTDHEYHIERIRSVMIMRPNAGVTEIRCVLQTSKSKLDLSEDYVCKIRQNIIAQRTERMRDNPAFAARLTEAQDLQRLAGEELMKIGEDESKSPIVRVMALSAFVKMEMMMFKAIVKTGLLDGNNQAMVPVRTQTDEQKTQVVRVMRRWGIVSDDEPENVIAKARP